MTGGIWCTCLKDGNAQLMKMIENYEAIKIMPTKVNKSLDSAYAVFDNGDFWQVIKIPSARVVGSRLNVSYIQRSIPEEVIQKVICPSTKATPFHSYCYFTGEGE